MPIGCFMMLICGGISRRSCCSRHRQWVGRHYPPPGPPFTIELLGRLERAALRQHDRIDVEYRADFHRSGMCKAGFAGDDAPRAVFRKSRLGTHNRDCVQMLSSTQLTITASIVGRPRHHG